MIRWLRSLFAWHPVRNTGVWVYWENSVTGQRGATIRMKCYQPLDRSFIRNGDVVNGLNGRYVVGSESEILAG